MVIDLIVTIFRTISNDLHAKTNHMYQNQGADDYSDLILQFSGGSGMFTAIIFIVLIFRTVSNDFHATTNHMYQNQGAHNYSDFPDYSDTIFRSI